MMIETYREENKSVNFINLAPGLIKKKCKKIFDTKKLSLLKNLNFYKKNLMDTPDEVALKVIKFLSEINKFKDRSYVDLRNG